MSNVVLHWSVQNNQTEMEPKSGNEIVGLVQL